MRKKRGKKRERTLLQPPGYSSKNEKLALAAAEHGSWR
jgi:hypothetical protein